MRQFGEDVSEQLEFVPASLKVVRHVRPKMACSCCDCIVQASAASRPIERGLAGLELLAPIIASKFADRLPLYRHPVIYERTAWSWIDHCWLADWADACSALLRPSVEANRHY